MSDFFLTFPEKAVVCKPGDHLICSRPGKMVQVYLVEDIVMIKKLVPTQYDPSSLMVQEHFTDSMSPDYHNEVYLLLTAFDHVFASEAAAKEAMLGQRLSVREKGLLRPAKSFTPRGCTVLS